MLIDEVRSSFASSSGGLDLDSSSNNNSVVHSVDDINNNEPSDDEKHTYNTNDMSMKSMIQDIYEHLTARRLSINNTITSDSTNHIIT